MTAKTNLLDQNKNIVRAFYEGGVRGDITAFRDYLHPDFVVQAPDYLPWGGTFKGAEKYLDVVLPQVAKVLDFGKFSYDSITAEDDRVVALINVGVIGSEAMIKISEHWLVRDGTARSIWVAYYEPAALNRQLELMAASGTKA